MGIILSKNKILEEAEFKALLTKWYETIKPLETIGNPEIQKEYDDFVINLEKIANVYGLQSEEKPLPWKLELREIAKRNVARDTTNQTSINNGNKISIIKKGIKYNQLNMIDELGSRILYLLQLTGVSNVELNSILDEKKEKKLREIVNQNVAYLKGNPKSIENYLLQKREISKI